MNGVRAPAPLRDGKQQLTIYCDRNRLEVFAGDGLTYVPLPYVPKADNLALGVKSQGGPMRFTALTVYELRSAW